MTEPAPTSSCLTFRTAARSKSAGPKRPASCTTWQQTTFSTLPLGGGCETFFTNAKAKVVALALVYHVRLSGGRDALWLDVDPGQAERLLKHLDHFLISEQAEFVDRTAAFGQFHLAGPKAKTVLETAIGERDPRPRSHWSTWSGRSAPPRPVTSGGTSRSACRAMTWSSCDRGPTKSGPACSPRVPRAASPETYEVLRIEAGTPVYGIDIDENRFAVEVGRPAAISYTKGCYLGQEPIVMARDRAGHVNRTFRGLKLSQPAAGGTKLLAADGKDVGILTSIRQSPRLGPIGLGYIRRGSEQPGTQLSLAAPADGTATVTDLPIV